MENKKVIIIEIPPPVVKTPKIAKKRGLETYLRIGRGYSIGEIREVGLTLQLAKQLNVPIDVRRRSIHQTNIENLRKFLDQISVLINVKRTKPAKIVVQQQQESKQ